MRFNVKGYKASPDCKEGTFSLQLKHDRKTAHLGSQRFLPKSHYYLRLRETFNGSIEEEKALKTMTGEEVYQRVNHLRVSYGKKKKIIVEKNVWKKRSIFFDLP